jgi:hypothetical protein
MAAALSLFPLLGFLLSPLVTLVHEIGHTVAAWSFGYPAIPAFDFGEGGGVTLSDERSPLIVLGLVAGLLYLAWLRRDSKPILAGIGAGLLAYALAFDRRGEDLLISFMGHGAELVFSGLFLYRGLTGWGCRLPVERPLYAFLGLFILFHDIRFAWGLISDPYARAVYLEGKRGADHDFVITGVLLGLSLVAVARLFLLAALAVVPLAVLAARQRRRIAALPEVEGP